MSFELHPQLRKDTRLLGKFPLCQLLLLNKNTLPWFILVPERADAVELYQLAANDRAQFQQESDLLARTLQRIFNADKLNIASIGNIVPQLHIHHIVRYQDDPVWPNVVWGALEGEPYSIEGITDIQQRLLPALSDLLVS